jgi:allantoin racemase
MRICFLNPFATDAYDGIIQSSLSPYLRADTELVVDHLDDAFPDLEFTDMLDLIEEAVLRAVVRTDRAGFDAMILGCCYDPGLARAREVTDMPIVGPLEAAVGLSQPFGDRFAVITDHRKAVPIIADLVRGYGVEPNCSSVSAIDWHIHDMIQDPAKVAADARTSCEAVMRADGADAVVLGCTIIAACFEQDALSRGPEADRSAIINPNVMALKVSEVLADLHRVGQYRPRRRVSTPTRRRNRETFYAPRT